MNRGLDGVRIVSGNVDGALSLPIVPYDHPNHSRRRPFIVMVVTEDCGYFANQTISFERA